MADFKSEFHRFLDVLAPQIKILNRQTMSDVPVCDVVLNLKHLLPPSPCPGDLATRIFQTHYLDQLLLELPPYECFNVIRPNNTALTANEYYARIEQLVKMKCTQPQFEISISAPIPLNLESLLETLRWAGSLTKLHIECEELSDGARASLLELIKDSTVEEYPLPQSVNYPEIVKAIKKRSKQNEPGWGWFS
jgi:hypothetical protein